MNSFSQCFHKCGNLKMGTNECEERKRSKIEDRMLPQIMYGLWLSQERFLGPAPQLLFWGNMAILQKVKKEVRLSVLYRRR